MIYVNFQRPPTLHEFLLKFFNQESTYGHYTSGVETYSDKECTKWQCSALRNRSIQDMWEIAKTYYPNTTLIELVTELVKLRPHGRRLYPFWCTTIRRPVMYYNNYGVESFPRKGTAEYSWGRLLREAGFNSLKELYA